MSIWKEIEVYLDILFSTIFEIWLMLIKDKLEEIWFFAKSKRS